MVATFNLIASGELNQGRWGDKDMEHALKKVRNALKIL
jgi:uncharacterized protein involved in outer membrane biogenesis